MTTEPKTWSDVWEEFKSPWYWWTIAITIGIMTILAAINKWIIHIPTFYKWD